MTKVSSITEKHNSTIQDVEEGSDYKTTGPQDRDIRKRQVRHHPNGESCNVAGGLNVSCRSLEDGFFSGMIVVGEFVIDRTATDIMQARLSIGRGHLR